jgi:hypothetical protein
VHVARFPADEGFVYLNLAAQLPVTVLHRKANPVQHEPRGFLSDAKSSVQLPRRNAVLTVGDQPRGGKPLIESKRRILKHSSDLHTELRFRMPGLALPHTARRNEGHVSAPAVRAHDTTRPAARHKVIQAVVRVSEKPDGFLKGAGIIAAHKDNIGQRSC